ncbi:hypothetical protein [Halosegnis sp.]|uniref:DUF7282 domain-containing protein n=1 Tax=Halosegnis sp. TaxID=2864959 RepID=UPI0035D4D3B7
MGRLAFAVCLLVAVVAAASVPLPVAAHVNDVNADGQVSPDGTLVVESVFTATDGFLAVQLDDGGEPGTVVGQTPVAAADGFVTDVRVTIDRAAWADWETQRVHLVLRQDDGDGAFEPKEDPVVTSFGQPAEAVVTVARGTRAVVTARGFGPQETDNGTVTVRQVAMPVDGRLVVENATSGRQLGSRTLAAGTHRNVTVAVTATGEITARAVLQRPDGEGGFEPVTIDGEPVATRFSVRAGTPTETAASTTTASPTATPPLVKTATATPSPDPTPEPTATDGQPGFTVLLALGALLVVAAVRARR